MSNLLHECYACGSDKTPFTKDGYPKWYCNKPTNFYFCDLCYKQLIDNPRYRESLKIKDNNGRWFLRPTAQDETMTDDAPLALESPSDKDYGKYS